MYSCSEVLAELSNYLDDEVTAEIRRELEQHVSHCRTCQVIYDSTRKTLRIVTESQSFELPEDVSMRVTKSIMNKVRGATRQDPPNSPTS